MLRNTLKQIVHVQLILLLMSEVSAKNPSDQLLCTTLKRSHSLTEKSNC